MQGTGPLKMRPMKILLTGAAGFIGMHTSLRLLAREDEVVEVDNLNDYYDVSLKAARPARLTPHKNLRFHKLSVEDKEGMARLCRDEKPDRVLPAPLLLDERRIPPFAEPGWIYKPKRCGHGPRYGLRAASSCPCSS